MEAETPDKSPCLPRSQSEGRQAHQHLTEDKEAEGFVGRAKRPVWTQLSSSVSWCHSVTLETTLMSLMLSSLGDLGCSLAQRQPWADGGCC